MSLDEPCRVWLLIFGRPVLNIMLNIRVPDR
jgi:hypothetical protein